MTDPKDPFPRTVTREEMERLSEELRSRATTPTDVQIFSKGIEEANHKVGWAKTKLGENPEDADFYEERSASAEQTSASAFKMFTEALSKLAQSIRASRPRNRSPAPSTVLRDRGLKCLLKEYPEITARQVIERLEADGRITFEEDEEDDVELRLEGASIVVRDLKEGADPASTTIAIESLREYLHRARNT